MWGCSPLTWDRITTFPWRSFYHAKFLTALTVLDHRMIPEIVLEVWLIGIIDDIVIILAVCHILPSQKLHSCFGQERVLRLCWSGGLRKNYRVMCLDVDYWEATNLALDIFGYLWVYGIRFKRIEIKTVQRERGPANSRRWPAATPRKSPDAAIKSKDIFEQHCLFKVSCSELCDLIGGGCMATALIWCRIESVL